MTRRQKDPLRPLTEEELTVLTKISRAQSEPASHVARAKALLAVASGQSYTAAARAAGRRSNDAVSQLVSRFNREGLAAIEPRHTVAVPRRFMGWRNGSVSWPNSSASPTARRPLVLWHLSRTTSTGPRDKGTGPPLGR